MLVTPIGEDVFINSKKVNDEIRYFLIKPIAKSLLDLLAQSPEATHLDVHPSENKKGAIHLNGIVYTHSIFGVELP